MAPMYSPSPATEAGREYGSTKPLMGVYPVKYPAIFYMIADSLPIHRSSVNLSDHNQSRTLPPRYRSHSPLKTQTASYLGSSDGKFSSSSSSHLRHHRRTPHNRSVPLITATDVIYLPEYGNVALVPLNQPHLEYLSHTKSLPLLASEALAAADGIPAYPPVSTERALLDIGSRVVSARDRDAVDSRSTVSEEADGDADVRQEGPRRSQKGDNGTDKEDEEPPLLYRSVNGTLHRAKTEEICSEESGSMDKSEEELLKIKGKSP